MLTHVLLDRIKAIIPTCPAGITFCMMRKKIYINLFGRVCRHHRLHHLLKVGSRHPDRHHGCRLRFHYPCAQRIFAEELLPVADGAVVAAPAVGAVVAAAVSPCPDYSVHHLLVCFAIGGYHHHRYGADLSLAHGLLV